MVCRTMETKVPGAYDSGRRFAVIRWCAYCQSFMGESEPFEDYSLTHGVCEKCIPIFDMEDEAEHLFTRINLIKRFHDALAEAGRVGDLDAAFELIEQARALGVRSADVLMGLVAPLLYEIGSLWQRGIITVEDEHRFTRFYSAIIRRIRQTSRVDTLTPPGPNPDNPEAVRTYEGVDVLLIQPRCNHHVLGLKLLEYWLWDRGVEALVLTLSSSSSIEDVIRRLRPRCIGVTVSIPDQMAEVEKLVAFITATAPGIPVLIGGSAVKAGLVAAPPGTTLMTGGGELLRLLAPAPTGPAL
jgi:hypothetical protein